MAEKDIGVSDTSESTLEDYEVDTMATDGPADQKETYYDNSNWTQQLGYYKQIPECMEVIDAKAIWTVGRGYSADDETTIILDAVKGFGVDTFNTILENMIRTYHIGGDSFAEIITDEDGELINLKPLDPSVIRIVTNRQGIIIRYEQRDKVKKSVKKFQPEEIFHLARNRVADEIHGVSMIDALVNIILMRNEAMTDYKKLMHRNVFPQIVWKLDTDNESKVKAFIAKVEKANADRENIFIPMGAVEREVSGVAPNATLNPLPWIEALNNYFFQAAGVPDIIIGGGTQSLTDASSKIKYLAFEQTIRAEQMYVEEQVLTQLSLMIKLEMPAKLENDMMSGKENEEQPEQPNAPQEEPMQGPEPNDTTAEMEGAR